MITPLLASGPEDHCMGTLDHMASPKKKPAAFDISGTCVGLICITPNMLSVVVNDYIHMRVHIEITIVRISRID